MVHDEKLDRVIGAQRPNHLQSRDCNWTASNRTQTTLLYVRGARFERREYRSIFAKLKAPSIMKIYDYKIVKAKNTEELSKDVAKQVAEGWQPLGAPFGIQEGIAQALVKHEE
jgi:hypothetical protein